MRSLRRARCLSAWIPNRATFSGMTASIASSVSSISSVTPWESRLLAWEPRRSSFWASRTGWLTALVTFSATVTAAPLTRSAPITPVSTVVSAASSTACLISTAIWLDVPSFQCGFGVEMDYDTVRHSASMYAGVLMFWQGSTGEEPAQLTEKGAAPNAQAQEREEADRHVDAGPSLAVPVHVGQEEPEGELVQGEGRADSEEERDQEAQPARVVRLQLGQVAAHQQEQDPPDQVVDVGAAGADVVEG